MDICSLLVNGSSRWLFLWGGNHFLPWFVFGIFKYQHVLLFGTPLLLIPVKIQPVAILPLWTLGSDPDIWNLGDPATVMHAMHHFDGNPAPDIAAHIGLWLPPLDGKVVGQAFQHGLRLSAHPDVHWDNERGKLITMLETGFQVLTFFIIHCLKHFLWNILYVEGSICINKSRVKMRSVLFSHSSPIRRFPLCSDSALAAGGLLSWVFPSIGSLPLLVGQPG